MATLGLQHTNFGTDTRTIAAVPAFCLWCLQSPLLPGTQVPSCTSQANCISPARSGVYTHYYGCSLSIFRRSSWNFGHRWWKDYNDTGHWSFSCLCGTCCMPRWFVLNSPLVENIRQMKGSAVYVSKQKPNFKRTRNAQGSAGLYWKPSKAPLQLILSSRQWTQMCSRCLIWILPPLLSPGCPSGASPTLL